jgi:hypothetical protein
VILKIRKNNDSMYSWDDIDYGDVCEFTDGEISTFIGMKVKCSDGKDYVVDLENYGIFTDFNNYGILRIIKNATLIEKEERVCEVCGCRDLEATGLGQGCSSSEGSYSRSEYKCKHCGTTAFFEDK